MVFVTSEKDPLLQSPFVVPRRTSHRVAVFAVSALLVVCFAAITVLEERISHPSVLATLIDIKTQPGQLGGADPYSPRRFSPYVSLSAPELLNAEEKLHEKKLNFFLKSQRDAGIIGQQPGLEISENSESEPEVSAPHWIHFPKHREHLAHKLQYLASGKLESVVKKTANMLDAAAELKNDPVFRESGRYDGASIMDNRRVRLALQKISTKLNYFNDREAKEQHQISRSLDIVGHKLSLRVQRDRDLIVSSF
jgi:hypothetical protein